MTLLDAESGDEYDIVFEANDTHESLVYQMTEWLMTDRLRIEDVNVGVRP